jgi:TetR/AcrR family transcriptional regulator
MTRLLTGDALNGENDRLRERISQFYARLESQIKQILREAQIRENLKPSIAPAALTSLLLAAMEGRLAQFVRSEFKHSPLEHWDVQWPYLSANLMMPFGIDDGFGSNAPAE